MIMNNDIEVLIIDDDQDVLESYQQLLEMSGYKVQAITDPTLATSLLHRNWPGVVVTDMYMPGLSGMELLEHIQGLDPDLPVIMITGHGDIPMAVDAVKRGALDFLQKPLQPKELLALLDKHLPVRKEKIDMRTAMNQSASEVLLGESPLIVKIREKITQIALTTKDVLVEGESGTGRHTVTKLLHQQSTLNKGPFVVTQGKSITCTADLQRAMISARSGTLSLNQPQEMPIETQQWLCRFLLEQERQNKKEVRVLAITGANPEALVEQETLLPELFYFLSQVRFQMPPLRQRVCDITPLFKYFLKQSCQKLHKSLPSIDKAYINTLNRHEWTGNVLELKNVAELYAIGIVKLTGQDRTKPLEHMSSPLDDLVDSYEKQVIEDALYLFAGRINDVSNYLQIPRKKLYLRMKKHSLDKAEYKARG
ncbi:sigma-54-dependent transcriptional regulator [Photobacterium aphoticum]|uniref:Chemotaxis protein CheY n=1 Tax=Photobacterium aphoticum TaxID=754436 RepID=A0A090R202_9GAMM|nr:sigma-54 dependent transcriptional regulator [Photobacterium aphoticum]KLU99371.1 chemotaxis protein CheY [Photobacterium aphoticum]PSU55032.1 sigma-54-dependent Fis family transcriptional regulator [Photobacterium aphoticum]GAL08139.1 phosphoglycerate transport system transcriptional regulatory protein PgtA [Photobacterium aphoticum]GHA64038.1 two-component system response regulator [Photobacterium aphoticum]